MPCATRRCGGSARRSIASSSALPLAGSAPIRARMKVVLPAPLRPIRPHISPSLSWSEASRMIGIGPIDTLSAETLSMGRGLRRGAALGAAYQFLHTCIRQRHGGRVVGDHGAIVERQYPVGEALD